jgi:hypothetical protein
LPAIEAVETAKKDVGVDYAIRSTLLTPTLVKKVDE